MKHSRPSEKEAAGAASIMDISAGADLRGLPPLKIPLDRAEHPQKIAPCSDELWRPILARGNLLLDIVPFGLLF